MGRALTQNQQILVSFEPNDGNFRGYLSLQGLLLLEQDPEIVLTAACNEYQRSVEAMRSLVADIKSLRQSRTLIPARKVWCLGHAIFNLLDSLDQLSLRIDGLYGHLVRDLDAKQKWLEKVVTLRRYVAEEDLIPESLNWGRCEKGTRKVAQGISEGKTDADK